MNFLADMGDRPAEMTLDRINVDGNYEPENCRWATRTQQNRNRRGNKLTESTAAEVMRRYVAGEGTPAIARSLGVGAEVVRRAARGETWRGVGGDAKSVADIVSIGTRLARQQRHIAESVAKSEAKREAAAATCTSDSLETNLRDSLRDGGEAHEPTTPGAA